MTRVAVAGTDRPRSGPGRRLDTRGGGAEVIVALSFGTAGRASFWGEGRRSFRCVWGEGLGSFRCVVRDGVASGGDPGREAVA
ncbi:hypothetical protein GCM10018791_07570 [Streptomyces zaomyceticus]|nr:hypothetical protein GCM10018791_07570 [Streptomyces zaomyceticus]